MSARCGRLLSDQRRRRSSNRPDNEQPYAGTREWKNHSYAKYGALELIF